MMITILVLEHKVTCFKISTSIIVRRIINPHVPTAQLQKLLGHLV